MTRWSRNSRPSWQSLALAMLAAGCDSSEGGAGPVEPGPGLVGTYRLEAPLTVYEGTQSDSAWGEYQLKVVATSGSLGLTSDSGYVHQLQLETFIDGQLSYRGHWTDHGGWRLEGDSLHFESGYIQNVAFKGKGSDGQVVLHQDVVGEGVLAVFPFQRRD